MTEPRGSATQTDRTVFGLTIQALTHDEVLERCRQALVHRRRMLIGVVNAAKIVNLRRDQLLRDSLIECDIIVADGQSVVWASRLVGQPLPERVAGCDLFESLLGVAEQDHRSVFLLGAKPEVLQLLELRLSQRFPKLRIAGSRDGYFTAEQHEDVAVQIRASGADMLFLGITSPKKEIFLGTYGDTLGVPIMHGVGGSFDVLAGVTKRAPVRWQRMGLEWGYRTLQEPRRMWKRYLTTNSKFLMLLGKEMVRPAELYHTPAPEGAPISVAPKPGGSKAGEHHIAKPIPPQSRAQAHRTVAS